MGKAERDKGHNFEREIARKFRELYPDAKRNVTEAQAGQGVDSVDFGPFDIQCKRYKAYASIMALYEVVIGGKFRRHAITDRELSSKLKQHHANGRIPALVTKADNLPIMVTLPLDDFLRILGDIGEAYGG